MRRRAVRIVVTGVEALVEATERKRKAVEEAARKQVIESTLRIEKDAKRLAPVDTGRLRSSIQREIEGLKGFVGTNVEYAAYVEFGTVRSPAQPFMQPAAEAERARLPAEMRKNIKDAVAGG